RAAPPPSTSPGSATARRYATTDASRKSAGSVLDDRPVADPARLEPVADLVDPVQGIDLDPRLHLSRGGEVERLDEITPPVLLAADQADLVRQKMQRVGLDRSIHQAHVDHPSLRPQTAQRLGGVRRRVRGPEDDVGAARL